jgi:hypothetical protein
MEREMNEADLEKMLLEMQSTPIKLNPTKMFVPRYQHESDDEYADRVEEAKVVLAQVGFILGEKK